MCRSDGNKCVDPFSRLVDVKDKREMEGCEPVSRTFERFTKDFSSRWR